MARTRSRRNNDDLKQSGLVLAVLAAVPIIETFIYNLHVGSGRQVLTLGEYVQLGIFALLLILVMILAFIMPRAAFKERLRRFSERLRDTEEKLKGKLVYVLLSLPILFLVVFLGGRQGAELLESIGIVRTVLMPVAQLVLVAVLIWLVARLLHALADQFRNLRGALAEWGFSVKVAIVFYVLLVAATVRRLDLSGINPDARLEFRLGVAKDYLLLFIIANMLYAGLYKVAHARSLRALFQTHKGFLHFVLVCAIIAILAIWADFIGMSAENQRRIFSQPWQRRYNSVHVYGRDIGLLLMPIGWLLFWCLSKFAAEPEPKETGGRQERSVNSAS